MAESLYRRKPKGNVIDVLKARRKLYNSDFVNTSTGQSTSVRNPCWVTMTGHNKACGGGGDWSLPIKETTVQSLYNYGGGSIKPAPDIESMTVEYAGDYGLARKITGRIRCYKIVDFEKVQKYFLLPGNEIDVSFGYDQNTWGVNQGATSLKGFTVAVFSFNTTQEGHWICEFTAVSAAQAITDLDMQITACNGCKGTSGGGDGPLEYFTYEFGGQKVTHKVKGIAELIAADAQVNGETSIDDIKDGTVLVPWIDYRPGSKNKAAAMVIYRGDHMRDGGQNFSAWLTNIGSFYFGKNEVESANNQVYVTLGYVVNRIINDQLLKAMGCGIPQENEKFNKLKIEFHNEYSKCKISDELMSGDPLSVLLLGNANYKNVSGDGKDFDKDCQNLGYVRSFNGGDITLANILLHRNVIVSCFNESTKPRKANSDQTDVKDSPDQVVNVSDFFKKIADHISACTGGAISLRLVENPDDMFTLIVVDQNFGVTDTLECIVFDPIDGDGSTRTCDVQSNVGSQEYRAAMFVGSSKKGDPISALRNCSPDLDAQRKSELTKAIIEKLSIIKIPGNLGKNHFNGDQINGLKSVMGRINRNRTAIATNENVHYPGLSITITIDGVWGFMPGNAISSSQVPKIWQDTYKSYFQVTQVTQNFQQSDWTTTLTGILAYFPKVKYTRL